MGFFVPALIAGVGGYLGWSLREDTSGNTDGNGGSILEDTDDVIESTTGALKWVFYILIVLVILNIIGVFK
jgi:hypothetical protein